MGLLEDALAQDPFRCQFYHRSGSRSGALETVTTDVPGINRNNAWDLFCFLVDQNIFGERSS